MIFIIFRQEFYPAMRNRLLLSSLYFIIVLLNQPILGQTLQQEIDSLENALTGANTDTVKLKLYNQLSILYQDVDPLICREYAKKEKDLSEKTGNKNYLFESNVRLMQSYLVQAKYDSALIFGLEAEKIAGQLGIEKIIEVQNEMADLYQLTSQYDKAFTRKFKLLKIADSINDENNVAAIYLDIGELYRDQNETDHAIEYLQKAYEAFKKLEITRGMLVSKANLALAYSQKDPSDALSIFEEFVDEFHHLFSKNDSARALGNLANYLVDLKRYDEAEKYILEAVEIRESLNYPLGLAFSYRELAEIYLRTGRYLQAYNYAVKGYPIAKEVNDARLLEMFSRQIAESSYELGNYKTAYEYYRDYKIFADSIDQTERVALSKELETRYETEKKEQQINLQSEQLARKESELARQSLFFNASLTGIVLLLIIGGLIYRSERLKTRKNQQIEALLKEIHHRVKNNLQVISSLLNMQSREVEDQDMLEAMKEGQNRVKAMSLIHQKLYQNENVTEIDFEEYAKDLCKQLSSVFSKPDQKIENHIHSNNIKLDIDTAIPLGLIVNELISNAYKYAFEGKEEGSIEIILNRIQKGELVLKVKDNGKGIPADFNIKEAKSLGLKLVNILTKQLKGQLDYKTENGTEFLINFKELAVATR